MREMSVNEVLMVAGITAFATFVLVPIVAEFPHYDWTELLYRWQTLIAGMLAVVAAYVTVGQMRASDLRSDRRHDDLINLTISADRRKLERALNPALSFLASIGARWASNVKWMLDLHRSNDVETLRGQTAIFWQTFGHDLDALDRVISARQFTEGEPLFDGETASRIDGLRGLLADLRQSMHEMAGFLDHGAIPNRFSNTGSPPATFLAFYWLNVRTTAEMMLKAANRLSEEASKAGLNALLEELDGD